MSIRLRLTLLYSGILALTLVAFSTALYFAQASATYNDLRNSLAAQVEGMRVGPRRLPQFSSGDPSGGTNLQGRWMQLRRADGLVSARTPDLADATLPLSAAGLRAVQSGNAWIENATVDGDPVMVYSQPIMQQGRVAQILQVAAPTAEREQSLNALRLILITGSLFVILATFVTGWIVSGAALNPIHRITQTAQAIGTERDFSRRVEHVGPNDEIGQLATTFNGMLTELESAYRQVEHSLQAQRRFVGDASHELRTPLTTIRGNIELLRHEPPPQPQEQADILSDARDEVDRLIRLVNQLLVLARADAGKPLRIERVALNPLIEDAYRQAKLLAPEREITCEAAPDLIVMGDRDALVQVLLILIDNARVHTPPGTPMHIRAAAHGERVTASVYDNGPGIAPNILPHIFERFYRGDVSRSRGGAGLGLAIAKELVHALGGTLAVTSQLRQGTEFTLTLPKAT